MTDSTAENTTEYIATALVGRQDAIHDHDSHGTGMVSNNLQGNIGILTSTVGNPGNLGGVLNDREQQICLEVVLYTLHNGGNTLQAHAGIDVLVLQVIVLAILSLVVLGKYIVPDFQITVAVAAYCTVRAAAASLLTQVNENLSIRTARARADFPEIVLQLYYMGRVKARLCLPQLLCLSILWIDGSPKLVLWQLQHLSQELPGPRNGFLLEVVAKGEVAQHLKIGLMTGGAAYVLNIAGTHAALAGGNASTRRLYLACKICFKRCHACTDHQQSRIIFRNQRSTRQSQMALFFSKELKVSLSQFVT